MQRIKFHRGFIDQRNQLQHVWQSFTRLQSFATGVQREHWKTCLVYGINDAGIQRQLLAEPKLSFKKAFALAQGIESVTQNVKHLQIAGTREEVQVATGTTHMQGVH